jgi:hypothetical protein
MKDITININTKNGAFKQHSVAEEVETILMTLAEEIHDNEDVRSHALHDSNGNVVGHITTR